MDTITLLGGDNFSYNLATFDYNFESYVVGKQRSGSFTTQLHSLNAVPRWSSHAVASLRV